MDSNSSSATAQFTVQIACPSPVRIARIPDAQFSILQSACDSISEGDMIQTQASEFVEDLTFSLPVAITLKGGYGCDYITSFLYTTVRGSITVSGGPLVMENIMIE
jgi:hypothetical protein